MAGEIFISYRRADQAKARLLHALLKQRGVDAWYDGLLGPGDDWRHKTAQALEAAPGADAKPKKKAKLQCPWFSHKFGTLKRSTLTSTKEHSPI